MLKPYFVRTAVKIISGFHDWEALLDKVQPERAARLLG